MNDSLELYNFVENEVLNDIPVPVSIPCSNKTVPSSIVNIVHSFLLNIQKLAIYSSSKQQIEAYVYCKTGKQLGIDTFSLKELDKIAKSYIRTNSYIATSEALLSLGGLYTMPIDLPIYLTIMCRMLSQLAWIYGTREKNENIILCLLVGSIDYSQIKDRENNMIRNGISYGITTISISKISYTVASHLSTKLFNVLPIIGTLVTFSTNYYYTKLIAESSLKILRREFIVKKYSPQIYINIKNKLFNEKKMYEKLKDNNELIVKIDTDWILIDTYL